ncbi:MAG: hypothetical protein KZQ60_00090 [Candidatus Thiodiazotropha sp. (ex Lucinoma aequizonata)]|nr:hypothetical protein [Candidatus Thiodiazotropha sp. (ex Lucinoma aequizonata)]
MHYSIMTTAMTLRRLGCALCMPFISPFWSPFRPYNRAYAYRGLIAFTPLSMAVNDRTGCHRGFFLSFSDRSNSTSNVTAFQGMPLTFLHSRFWSIDYRTPEHLAVAFSVH